MEASPRHVFHERRRPEEIARAASCDKAGEYAAPVGRSAAFHVPRLARRALPARVWQLSRLTLACDAFNDRHTGVAWSGAEAERCMSRSTATYARRRSHRMTTGYTSMQRWRSSATRSRDKLVIKQCFRGPQASTLLFSRARGGSIVQRDVGLAGIILHHGAILISKGTICSCDSSNMRP